MRLSRPQPRSLEQELPQPTQNGAVPPVPVDSATNHAGT